MLHCKLSPTQTPGTRAESSSASSKQPFLINTCAQSKSLVCVQGETATGRHGLRALGARALQHPWLTTEWMQLR